MKGTLASALSSLAHFLDLPFCSFAHDMLAPLECSSSSPQTSMHHRLNSFHSHDRSRVPPICSSSLWILLKSPTRLVYTRNLSNICLECTALITGTTFGVHQRKNNFFSLHLVPTCNHLIRQTHYFKVALIIPHHPHFSTSNLSLEQNFFDPSINPILLLASSFRNGYIIVTKFIRYF